LPPGNFFTVEVDWNLVHNNIENGVGGKKFNGKKKESSTKKEKQTENRKKEKKKK